MFMYRAVRLIDAVGWWLLLAALLVIPVSLIVQDSSSRSGLLTTLPGAVLSETLLVLALAGGYAFRVRSRRITLAQLTDLRPSELSFVTALDGQTFRWLAQRSTSPSLWSAPPSVVNAVGTNAGLEFYWPLQAHPLHLIHLIAWPEISSVTFKRSGWNPGVLIVQVRTAPANLRFVLARTTLIPLNDGQRLVEAIDRRRS